MGCDYEGCRNRARYCVEWRGLDQHGKNPNIADERYACSNPEHIIALSKHDCYGGYPDEIYNIQTDRVQSRLLFLVKEAIDGNPNMEGIDNLVSADPLNGQLTLFSER